MRSRTNLTNTGNILEEDNLYDIYFVAGTRFVTLIPFLFLETIVIVWLFVKTIIQRKQHQIDLTLKIILWIFHISIFLQYVEWLVLFYVDDYDIFDTFTCNAGLFVNILQYHLFIYQQI